MDFQPFFFHFVFDTHFTVFQSIESEELEKMKRKQRTVRAIARTILAVLCDLYNPCDECLCYSLGNSMFTQSLQVGRNNFVHEDFPFELCFCHIYFIFAFTFHFHVGDAWASPIWAVETYELAHPLHKHTTDKLLMR